MIKTRKTILERNQKIVLLGGYPTYHQYLEELEELDYNLLEFDKQGIPVRPDLFGWRHIMNDLRLEMKHFLHLYEQKCIRSN